MPKVVFQVEGATPVEIACNQGDNLLELARRANPKRLWLTHYSPSLNRPDEFLPLARKIFPATETCKDGKTIELVFEDEQG